MVQVRESVAPRTHLLVALGPIGSKIRVRTNLPRLSTICTTRDLDLYHGGGMCQIFIPHTCRNANLQSPMQDRRALRWVYVYLRSGGHNKSDLRQVERQAGGHSHLSVFKHFRQINAYDLDFRLWTLHTTGYIVLVQVNRISRVLVMKCSSIVLDYSGYWSTTVMSATVHR